MLCLRDARGSAGRRARWLGLAALGLVISTCGVLLAARSLRAPSVVEPQRAVDGAPFTEAPAAPAPARVAAVEAALPATDWAENKPDSQPEAPALAASTLSSVLVPAASAEPAPRARVPSSSDLSAALRATPVSMFSTSWCPHCERARRFFRANGVSVVEHDIDVDARAAAELQRRSGGKAVPLIDVDGIELRGFDQRATVEALAASVERRLRVAGVKLSVISVPVAR